MMANTAVPINVLCKCGRLAWGRGVCKRCRNQGQEPPCTIPATLSLGSGGIYGRAQYEHDLQEIERLSALVSAKVADGTLHGMDVVKCNQKLELLRELCRKGLLRTRFILSLRDEASGRCANPAQHGTNCVCARRDKARESNEGDIAAWLEGA